MKEKSEHREKESGKVATLVLRTLIVISVIGMCLWAWNSYIFTKPLQDPQLEELVKNEMALPIPSIEHLKKGMESRGYACNNAIVEADTKRGQLTFLLKGNVEEDGQIEFSVIGGHMQNVRIFIRSRSKTPK